MNKRMALGKEDGERIDERFGISNTPRPDGKLVWIHGASVGESVSALPLIERLQKDRPDLKILVTTGTVTSAQVMGRRLPQGVTHQFAPIDTQVAVRSFFDHWRPQLGLIIESEFWPNLLLEARRRKIPLHLVNGRMSPKSFKGWRHSGPIFSKLLDCFETIQAQSPEDAEHFEVLGFEACSTPGNLKFAAPALSADPNLVAEFQARLGERPHWLFYSSHPGEERMAAQTHQLLAPSCPDLLTVIVPRHPERGSAIAAELRTEGLEVAQRSPREPLTPKTQIYLADTLGELGLWFRLNQITVTGGTFVPKGGQSPIEPAKLGCAVLCGPHTANFTRVVEDMIAAGAAQQITDRPGSLAFAIRKLMNNPAHRDDMTASAQAYADTQSDVLNRTIALLEPAFEKLR